MCCCRSALPGGDKEIPDAILDRVMQEVDKLPADQRQTEDSQYDHLFLSVLFRVVILGWDARWTKRRESGG